MELGLRNNIDAAMEFYNSAVEVLEWGRQVWRDEPKENRGVVFENSFVRGVKHLRLEAVMKVRLLFQPLSVVPKLTMRVRRPSLTRRSIPSMTCTRLHRKSSRTSRATQKLQMGWTPASSALFGSTRWHKLTRTSLSSLGFVTISVDMNHSVVAIYYRQLAKLHRNEPQSFAKYMEQSAEMYLQAAAEYPPDDEFHTCASPLPLRPPIFKRCLRYVRSAYLLRALEINYFRRASVGTVLPIFRLLHMSTPVMMPIWEFSATMLHANRAFENQLAKMLMRGDALLTDLEKGKVTEEDKVGWDEVFR